MTFIWPYILFYFYITYQLNTSKGLSFFYNGEKDTSSSQTQNNKPTYLIYV